MWGWTGADAPTGVSFVLLWHYCGLGEPIAEVASTWYFL